MNTPPKPGTDDLCQLLPWYANGTLEGDEMSAFEQHLEQCEHCQQELPHILAYSRSHQATANHIQNLQDRQAQGLENLLNTINNKESAKVLPLKPKRKTAQKWFNVAIAAMCLVAFTPFIYNSLHSTDTGYYDVLTSNPESNHARIQIVLHQDSGIDTLLPALSAYENYAVENVGRGVFIVGFESTATANAALQSLESNSAVRWVTKEY